MKTKTNPMNRRDFIASSAVGLEGSVVSVYPRLVTNLDNNLVVMYYWGTKEKPQGHVAATILTPIE